MSKAEIIEKFDPVLELEYENFILNHCEAMMYHSIKYCYFLTSLIGAKPIYIISRRDNKIEGVLPLMYKDGKLGRVINSLPYYGSNGSILASTDESKNLLIEEYNRLVEQKNIAASTIITNPFIKDFNINSFKKNHLDTRLGQITDIEFNENHEEQILKKIHYKTRNAIRKALKNQVQIFIDNSKLEEIYDIHKENMISIGGLPKQFEIIKNIKKFYSENIDYKLYVAKHDEKIISGLLVFYFKNTVEYYMPVIKKEYRSLQPLSLLIFNAMTEASINGFKFWNWGGTWENQPGVYLFKKRWGSFTKKYYYLSMIVNQDIYSSVKETLLDEYPNFFVIPFDKLKENE